MRREWCVDGDDEWSFSKERSHQCNRRGSESRCGIEWKRSQLPSGDRVRGRYPKFVKSMQRSSQDLAE
jgi:hypothetical protein